MGKIAQAVEGRDLAVDPRLGFELRAVEREAAFHKAEVVAQCIGEANVRGVRLNGKRNGPGNLGYAIGSLGEGPSLRPRDLAVLSGDINRSLTREYYGCLATRTDILVFKLEREVCRDMNVRRIPFKPALVKRKDNLIVFNLPYTGFSASAPGPSLKTPPSLLSTSMVSGNL